MSQPPGNQRKAVAKKLVGKRRKTGVKTPPSKACSACGADNPYRASACQQCSKTRFEPAWVRAHRPINRQFGVQITSSNPHFGEVRERVTLNKWWQGGSATFHFPNPDQWHQVETIINTQLGPILGWKGLESLVDGATQTGKKKDQAKSGRALAKLASDYPSFLKELVRAIDPDKLSKQDFESMVETFGEISDALTNANAGFREVFLSVVKKLPSQKQRALEDLDLLLQGWSLHVITNVAQQVRSRLETIALFEQQIQDSRTFEIRGDHSIHRILERAMWLVDENYWLLHSNTTLRKSIGAHMQRVDKKKYGTKRPDFVCGTVGDRLILLELKRPGHTLDIDDVNQLETYLSLAEKYFTFRTGKGFLVGSKTDEELTRRLKYRAGVEILHYANIIDATKKRYHGYLTTLEKEE